MATLSSTLIQGLANPGYSGMLSQSVGGGMQDISDAFKQQRQSRALESMFAILNNSDPTDPNVVTSVMDVARQTNMDPAQAQQLVDQAQARHYNAEQNKRAKQADARSSKYQAAENARAEERLQQSRIIHKYQVLEQQRQDTERKAVQAAVAAYNRNPENIEQIKQSVPEDAIGAVTEALDKEAAFRVSMEKYQDQVRSRNPFSEETLQSMSSLKGMDDAIKVYRSQVQNDPVLAKSQLTAAYRQAHQASLYARNEDRVTDGQINNALELVNELSENTWFKDDPLFSGFGDFTGQSLQDPIPEELKLAVATEAARRSNGGKWIPTPENIKAIVDEIQNPTEEEMTGEGDEYTNEQKSDIQSVIDNNPGYTREQAIQLLKDNERL